MKNVGKKFEEDFFKSIPFNFSTHRIKDGSARTDKQGNIIRFKNKSLCDFRMFNGRILHLLELKSVKGKTLNFSNIDKDVDMQKEKLLKLFNESIKENVKAGFVINFREVNKTYFVDINKFLTFYNETDKKSININDVVELNGQLIKQKLKRVRYTYNIKEFFK